MNRLFKTVFCMVCLVYTQASLADELLASWSANQSKTTIVSFVEAVSQEGSANYVPPAQRIAVFDNDGTLWSEQPAYFQLLFAMDRIKSMATQHPEWKSTQPFQAVLEGDMKSLAASGKRGLLQIVAASHAGMSTEAFEEVVTQWIGSARHPSTQKLYTQMVYQPMLEVLDYLRAHGFKTFIVSGGGIEFMRPWTEAVYGIPPEQVVGSSIKTRFVMSENGPELQRLPEIDFIDDKEGKPVGIHNHIGRRPILAFGNSDGDLQMLQWTTAGKGKRLGVIIHHTDSEREWAYDRESHIGQLDQALDLAKQNGWLVVDMRRDWQTIYPLLSE